MSAIFRLDDAVAVLQRTPGVLRAWLGGLPEAWLLADEGPDSFSPREVLGHLVHGERADWIPRARIILEDGPARPFDPYDRFAQRREMEGRPTALLLEDFTDLRAQNLAVLRGWSLTDERLDAPGRHPDLGPVTLRQLLATWTAHDLSHLGQIARVMAKRYREAVGPWRAYLPLLDRPSGDA